MHWTALIEQRHFPPHAMVTDDVPCINCGYNLRAARAVGMCPECGRPVSDSLWALAKPDQVASGLRSIGKSYLGLLAVILIAIGSVNNSWVGWVGAIVLVGTTMFRAFGVAELRYRAALDKLPVIGRQVRMLWPLSLLEVVLLTGWLAALLSSQSSLPATTWSRITLVLPCAAWGCTAFATAVMAGSMGAALAALLGYESVARELRAQCILVLAGPAVASVLGLGSGLLSVLWGSPSPLILASVPLLSLGVCWLVALGLMFTGMLHLANGAERERDPLDHLVDVPRTHIVPDRANDDKDNLPPIKMEP